MQLRSALSDPRSVLWGCVPATDLFLLPDKAAFADSHPVLPVLFPLGKRLPVQH